MNESRGEFMETTKFYGTAEAAKLTGLKESMLRKGVKSGRFPVVKTEMGGKFLFDIQAIVKVLEAEATQLMQNKNQV
jgi:excisionase family DNA binding protein